MGLIKAVDLFDRLATPKRKRPFTEPIGLDIGLRFPKLGTNGK